ncbi:hypothetical protein AKUH3B110M_UNKNOWN200070 (plasmid) [Apilactobacillus kunkeei]|nr:hypothetical protein AKUH3B110M_UNKNOWN200070 [Apilactobacillus kunkeei]CAI2698993.1 hypothetical protein AKUH4B501J_UNKNOWN200070 [Apilactobacillus kunkeei]CAI2700388.1 hypothetical protein AKUH3B102X_UNKNOWN200070 [Apilactobacillus kunkeei]
MNNIINDINQTLQMIKVIGQDIVLSALVLILILPIIYLVSYSFRQHIKWFLYKRRHLLLNDTPSLDKAIMRIRLKISKNDLKIIANKKHANRSDYDDFDKLMNDMPNHLEDCFNMSFNDDGNKKTFIFTFTAKRKKNK